MLRRDRPQADGGPLASWPVPSLVPKGSRRAALLGGCRGPAVCDPRCRGVSSSGGGPFRDPSGRVSRGQGSRRGPSRCCLTLPLPHTASVSSLPGSAPAPQDCGCDAWPWLLHTVDVAMMGTDWRKLGPAHLSPGGCASGRLGPA